jgi:hypothetical protein
MCNSFYDDYWVSIGRRQILLNISSLALLLPNKSHITSGLYFGTKKHGPKYPADFLWAGQAVKPINHGAQACLASGHRPTMPWMARWTTVASYCVTSIIRKKKTPNCWSALLKEETQKKKSLLKWIYIVDKLVGGSVGEIDHVPGVLAAVVPVQRATPQSRSGVAAIEYNTRLNSKKNNNTRLKCLCCRHR